MGNENEEKYEHLKIFRDNPMKVTDILLNIVRNLQEG